MLTDLEKSLNGIVDVYHKYSLVQGNYHALYKDDMKKLVAAECPQYMKKKDVETWFKELDFNEDNAINFEEFLAFVTKMGVIAHRESHKH